MRLKIAIVIAVLSLALSPALALASTWAGSSGGDFSDIAYSIHETIDGGFIVAGYTDSFGAGDYDCWVLKLDANGSSVWQKTYGGSDYDAAFSIQKTSDSGFIVVGTTYSFGSGESDCWVLKLDSTGSVVWQKAYGGNGWDGANSVQETLDGGFIVAGWTDSFGSGGNACWVLKLDSTGNVVWQKAYGGSYDDSATSIQETLDGGFIVAGYTNSFGSGSYDFWVLKLDSTGNVVWQKACGGTDYDSATSIQETSNGGFIVAGSTESFGTGSRDFWVLKLDSTGNVVWQKAYGGSAVDSATSIQETLDGGFIVAGYTQSFGAGEEDFWVLKLDSTGNVVWQKACGGTDYDIAYSIQETSDSGFIVAGTTYSFGAGISDYWVLKLNANGNISDCDLVGDTTGTANDTVATVLASSAVPAVTTAVTSVTIDNTYVSVEKQCFDEGLPSSVGGILTFFDVSVADGTLEGTGSGWMAVSHLQSMRSTIEDASGCIDRGAITPACWLLNRAYTLCDSEPYPGDYVQGPAVTDLAAMINKLREWLGCE